MLDIKVGYTLFRVVLLVSTSIILLSQPYDQVILNTLLFNFIMTSSDCWLMTLINAILLQSKKIKELQIFSIK